MRRGFELERIGRMSWVLDVWDSHEAWSLVTTEFWGVWEGMKSIMSWLKKEIESPFRRLVGRISGGLQQPTVGW